MRTRTLAALAVIPLALTACGGGSTTHPSSPTPSASASASASPSKSATPSSTSASATPTEGPTVEATAAAPEPTAAAAAEPTQATPAPAQAPEAPAADPLQQFFATGGQCISDVWTSSMPYDAALLQQIYAYCDANDLGDWADGQDAAHPFQHEGTSPAPADDAAAGRAYCESLDPETAMSADIQNCYFEYGVDVQ